jgi:hypothetical protein
MNLDDSENFIMNIEFKLFGYKRFGIKIECDISREPYMQVNSPANIYKLDRSFHIHFDSIRLKMTFIMLLRHFHLPF